MSSLKKVLFCNNIGDSIYFMVKEITNDDPNEVYHVYPGVVLYVGIHVPNTEADYILEYSKNAKNKKKIRRFSGVRVYKSL